MASRPCRLLFSACDPMLGIFFDVMEVVGGVPLVKIGYGCCRVFFPPRDIAEHTVDIFLRFDRANWKVWDRSAVGRNGRVLFRKLLLSRAPRMSLLGIRASARE